MQRSDTLTYLPFMVVYLAAAVVFMLVKIFAPGFTLSFAIKVIPALSLALATLFVSPMKTFQRMMMLAGALFCGAGDVILDIDRLRLFVPGLAAFLFGHVGFLALFWMRRISKNPRRIWMIPVLIFALAMAFVLIPRLDSLLMPVLAYLVVITLMTVFAIISDVKPIAAVGAFVFMISDALLALAKFVLDGQPSPHFTIPVYFAGLFLLGFGVLWTGQSRSFIEDEEVIKKILRHLGLWEAKTKPPPKVKAPFPTIYLDDSESQISSPDSF